MKEVCRKNWGWRKGKNCSSENVSGGPNKNNPNLFPIGDGFGLFVSFGKLAFAKQ
nr:MAG TPA: hypothetical protein [Caudoviricetes sp.]